MFPGIQFCLVDSTLLQVLLTPFAACWIVNLPPRQPCSFLLLHVVHALQGSDGKGSHRLGKGASLFYLCDPVAEAQCVLPKRLAPEAE